jgi:hypothetical protein
MLSLVKLFLEYGDDMLIIAASMIGGFILAALLSHGYNDDDDNGPDKGLMSPVFEGV